MNYSDDSTLGVCEILNRANLSEEPSLVLVVTVNEMINLDIIHFDLLARSIVLLDKALEIHVQLKHVDFIGLT
jgi:hypothetical protein